MYKRKTDDKLLEELLKQGYGDDERKQWRDKWRRNQQAKGDLERRRHGGPAGGEGGQTEKQRAAEGKNKGEFHRRAEDEVKSPVAKLRRRIDAYAYRRRYRATGIYERFLSF